MQQAMVMLEDDALLCVAYVQVRVNDDSHMETLERQTYGGSLRSPFTAHPKIDPATGGSSNNAPFWVVLADAAKTRSAKDMF